MDTNKKLQVKYDEIKDVLHVTIGEEIESMVVETEENFYMSLSVETGEIIGYSISNYSENVHKNREWSDKLLTIPENIIMNNFSVKKEKRAA